MPTFSISEMSGNMKKLFADISGQKSRYAGMLRLNVFKGIELPKNGIDKSILNYWQIKKDIEWLDPCPLPDGEEFKRLS